MQKNQQLTAAVLAAVAQEAPAPASQGLEEIVITAERRSQSVQTAPLAVTAVTKVDLSLAYNAPSDSWSITGFVNNATNKAVLNAAFVNTIIKAAMAGIEAPRTYRIRAAFKF